MLTHCSIHKATILHETSTELCIRTKDLKDYTVLQLPCDGFDFGLAADVYIIRNENKSVHNYASVNHQQVCAPHYKYYGKHTSLRILTFV